MTSDRSGLRFLRPDDGRFASWCGSCAKARRSPGIGTSGRNSEVHQPLFRRIDKREEEKMHKQYEDEPRRIEHADDATITFTIALHGPHAWEMVLEDSRRYHSISHGWATDDPHGWEDAIAAVLRQFFGKPLTPRRAALKVLGEHAAVLASGEAP